MKIEEVDALARLRAIVKKAGTQQDAAKQLKCSAPHIGDLLKGRRAFSESMLAKLGLRRSVVEL